FLVGRLVGKRIRWWRARLHGWTGHCFMLLLFRTEGPIRGHSMTGQLRPPVVVGRRWSADSTSGPAPPGGTCPSIPPHSSYDSRPGRGLPPAPPLELSRKNGR